MGSDTAWQQELEQLQKEQEKDLNDSQLSWWTCGSIDLNEQIWFLESAKRASDFSNNL